MKFVELIKVIMKLQINNRNTNVSFQFVDVWFILNKISICTYLQAFCEISSHSFHTQVKFMIWSVDKKKTVETWFWFCMDILWKIQKNFMLAQATNFDLKRQTTVDVQFMCTEPWTNNLKFKPDLILIFQAF